MAGCTFISAVFYQFTLQRQMWVMQAMRKQKSERLREGRQRRPLANSAVIASSHFKKKRVLRMKNWSIDLFNQELTQELSFRIPLAADKTEIKYGTLSFRFYIFDIQRSATWIDHIRGLCLFQQVSKDSASLCHGQTKHFLGKPSETYLSIPFFFFSFASFLAEEITARVCLNYLQCCT